MLEFIQKIWLSLICFLQNLHDFVNPFLQRLDPALFQNIILGVLALFVPLGVGILSYFFSKKAEKEASAHLELLVLIKEVLQGDKVVLYSIIGLVLFAISDFLLIFKFFAIIFFIFYIFGLFLSSFKKIGRGFFEKNNDFSIIFLKRLNVKNNNENIIVDAWQSLWLGEGVKKREAEFTNFFLTHIDESIGLGNFSLAVQLGQIYINNIEKRDNFLIEQMILPKLFEGNEIFFKEHSCSLRDDNIDNKNLIIKLTKKFQKKASFQKEFGNGRYFGGDFFQAIVKKLLTDSRSVNYFFILLKKYIEKKEVEIDKSQEEEEKEEIGKYIVDFFNSFCNVFFEEIEKRSIKLCDLRYFPEEWRVEFKNKDNRMSWLFLDHFLKGSEDKIFKKEGENKYTSILTNIINIVFPNVHPSLFTAFLMLFFSERVCYKTFDTIKYLFEQEPNFYIINSGNRYAPSFDLNESEESIDRKLLLELQKQREEQRRETVRIIFNSNYFSRYGKKLKIITEGDVYEKANDDEKFLMGKNAVINNLKEVKLILESKEIMKLCVGQKKKSFFRKDLVELMDLLLKEVKEQSGF